MADLWIPGVPRIDTSDQGLLLGFGGEDEAYHTWHTFETGAKGYDYSYDGLEASRYLISQRSTSHFVLHPTTGALVQLLPANMGARTLRVTDPRTGEFAETNRRGRVHFQTEVIANAARPFTFDLTRAGLDALTTLMNFLRAHGVPDQWAWTHGAPPIFPGGSVPRRMPDRSGHAYHAGWPVNNHGDPGAIEAPWVAIEKEVPVATNTKTPADVATLETELRRRGYDIYDGPSLVKAGICTPTKHGHLSNSTHYVDARGGFTGTRVGGAIDVGRDPSSGAAISTYEKAHMDDLARELMGRGFRCIWGVAAHFDHLHVDYNVSGGHQVVFQGPNAGFTVAHILWVQKSLKTLGYYTGTLDGLREAGTIAAIKAFQSKSRLTADALPGDGTTAAIKKALAADSTPTEVDINAGFSTEHIKWVQTSLKTLGYYKDAIDGLRGPNTQAAIKAFQSKAGLSADGLPGANTTNAIKDALAEAAKPAPAPKPAPTPEPKPETETVESIVRRVLREVRLTFQ